MKPIIPEAALGQHIAVLGKTGSGKSFAAKASIVEPLLEAHRRVAVIDPTDAWWGLRSSRDGKGPGFKVLVLGGDHGDLPLPASGGAAVARLLVEQGCNLVVSTKHLTVGERTRWFIDFAGTVSRLNRSPLHLVIDEAHNFAPQGKVPDPDTGKMLHAANALASEGRSKGIRLVMITQRPQKLHKDALTSADTLIAMRVLAPHDRLAVEDWIKGCGDPQHGKQVLNSLASLQRGEGWVWYPEGSFLPERVKFPHIKTFDSSATPAYGEQLATPKGAAEIDLAEIRTALADAVKQAEANDPRLLRAEIARLKADAAKRPVEKALVIDHDAVREAEQRGYERGKIDAAYVLRDIAAEAKSKIHVAAGQLNIAAGHVDTLVEIAARKLDTTGTAIPTQIIREKFTAPRTSLSAQAKGGNGSLPKSERLILTALAQYPQGRSKVQVAVLTGYAVNGGAFNNALGSLRSRSLVTRGEPIQITETGLRTLGAFDPLPLGRALLDHWYANLGRAERLVLTALAEQFPGTLNKQQVAVKAGYESSGGAFNNAIGRLRTLELIRGRGELRASEALFE